MPAKDFNAIKEASQVVKDRPDLRDLPYRPTLANLKSWHFPDDRLIADVRDQWDPKAGVAVNNCTAQALAGIIDMQRAMLLVGPGSRADGERPSTASRRAIQAAEAAGRVSAGMLFFRGHEVEAAEQGVPFAPDSDPINGLRSLRSALKGFFHNGVCSEQSWLDRADEAGGSDSVKIGKEARQIPLGAYYRLQPILNDYHAAINEVGAIYAAAEIHDGWDAAKVSLAGGLILPPADGVEPGNVMNHAFVIVGYNQEGFLVLNSWGVNWGGYRPSWNDPLTGKAKTGPALPGVALWRYRDWAERIIDGWVLRLGVTAPDAFRYSFAPQGLAGFLSGEISYVSTPRHELAGHYVHLDDGALVLTGTLPSAPESISATRQLIETRYSDGGNTARKGAKENAETKYEHVLIWIAGGNEPTKEAANQIAATKDFWKSKGVYPVTILWCSDFIESALGMLGRAFEDALAKVGKPGPSLDVRVETEARGVGRAFWRDIKESARKAAAKDRLGDQQPAGGMYLVFEELLKLDKGIKLHFVAEGAGAILLADLLREIPPEELERIDTITLNMPACTVEKFDDSYAAWLLPNGRSIDILVPDEAAEKRMRVGPYGGSLLDLVQMSFEEETPKRKRLDGTGSDIVKDAPLSSRILGRRKVAEDIALRRAGRVSAVALKGPAGEDPIRTMRQVTLGRQAQEHIHKLILNRKLIEPKEIVPRLESAVAKNEICD
jgi:hypothetical protein